MKASKAETTEQTNLYKLAQNLSAYTAEEIRVKFPQLSSQVELSKYKQEEKDKHAQAAEFLKSLGAPVDYFFYVSYQDGNPYVSDHRNWLTILPGCDFLTRIAGNDYANKNKFYFWITYEESRQWDNLTNSAREEAKKSLSKKEPARIGKFTANKVNAWSEYLTKYREAMNSAAEKAESKNDAIRKQIEELIETHKKHGGKVYENHKNIYLETEEIEIRLVHHEGSQYLESRVTWKGSLNDAVKAIKLIADNKNENH